VLNSIIALQPLSIIDTIFTVACKKEGGEGGERKWSKGGRKGGREERGKGRRGFHWCKLCLRHALGMEPSETNQTRWD